MPVLLDRIECFNLYAFSKPVCCLYSNRATKIWKVCAWRLPTKCKYHLCLWSYNYINLLKHQFCLTTVQMIFSQNFKKTLIGMGIILELSHNSMHGIFLFTFRTIKTYPQKSISGTISQQNMLNNLIILHILTTISILAVPMFLSQPLCHSNWWSPHAVPYIMAAELSTF